MTVDTPPPPATGSIRTPFRILPSRGPEFTVLAWVAAACGAALVAGVAVLSIAPREGGVGVAVLLLLGIFGTLIAIQGLRREQRYFSPGAAYWMDIAADHFGLTTPDTNDVCPWAEIDRFEVVEMQHRSRHGRSWTSYEVVGLYRRYHLNIKLNDFATRLGKDDQERAVAICAILNDLRGQAMSGDGRDFTVTPPAGLVVTEEKLPRRRPAPPVVSVVDRQ
jgi:hypothetical protein